jgi:hypothetical protein
VIEDDHRVTVSGFFEGVDERVAGFEEEPVVPLVDDARHVALVDDPALLGEFAGYRYRDLVVVAVRARALTLVVLDAVARTDADRPITTDVEGSFTDIQSRRSCGTPSRYS